MRRVHIGYSVIVFVGLGIATFTGCAPKYTGPWDVTSLEKAPAFEWADSAESGKVRSLYYTGEPYKGHKTRVFAYYAAPAGDSIERTEPSGMFGPRKRGAPGIVLIHGGGGRAFRQWAEMWAERGYAAIAMDLSGRGPDGKRLEDGGPEQGDDVKFNDIAGGVREAWPYHAVANVIRAHSLLRSMPGVDADRTAVTGISWGGYLTCIVAGLDDRFKAAVPVYGCGYLYEDSAWVAVFSRLGPDNRQAWIDSYDPSKYLPGANMPILFVNGTNDFAYPLGSYQKSYRLVRGPRTLSITTTLLHSHEHGWAPTEIGLFVDSVLKGGAPLARFGQVNQYRVKVSAEYSCTVPIQSAQLCYTTDLGPWQKRAWRTIPAHVDAKVVSADLPISDGITWFLTSTDQRGATVSTPHTAIAKRAIAGSTSQAAAGS